MIINRGYQKKTTAGNRQTIYCEGEETGVDIIFYTTVLGYQVRKFSFEALGSSNILISFAETKLIKNGFCLIDRDFRTDQEIKKLESKYRIKFLPVHEIEYFLLNTHFLAQLPYFREGVDIQDQINQIIQEKQSRFLADFLQFKINTHLGKFPRINKLSNSELPAESKIVNLLLDKLQQNYSVVEEKIEEIKDHYIPVWQNQFKDLTLKQLPAKEIFKTLKNRIFNNPPKESDIAKDIATLMEQKNYIPEELKQIFSIN